MPDAPALIPPHGVCCGQCAFFGRVLETGGLGDCLYGPPEIYSTPTDLSKLEFRHARPRLTTDTRACSQFMSPEEWAVFRARHFGLEATTTEPPPP